MKKVLTVVLSVLLCASMAIACASVPKSLDGTFTCTFSKDDITSNTFHNGFVTALGANEVNTITFSPDGTYSYVKELHTEDDSGSVVSPDNGGMAILITYTYTGTYSMNGNNAVLDFPQSCTFSENWGPLGGSYFTNSSGTYTWNGTFGDGDLVNCKEDETHNPMDIFVNSFVQDYLTTSESGFSAENTKVTVTPDTAANTFTYVIVNTDDD